MIPGHGAHHGVGRKATGKGERQGNKSSVVAVDSPTKRSSFADRRTKKIMRPSPPSPPRSPRAVAVAGSRSSPSRASALRPPAASSAPDVRAVLFDMDGVLTLSEDLARE